MRDSSSTTGSPPFLPLFAASASSSEEHTSTTTGNNDSTSWNMNMSSKSGNSSSAAGTTTGGSGSNTSNNSSSASGSARGRGRGGHHRHNHHHHQQQQQHHQHSSSRRKLAQDIHNRALGKKAQQENDAMVYLDGPQVYTCGNCRTHLTSHDDIISKSFHGRHGRAYLFDQCVNVTTGPPEDRMLITGLHSVSDIFCKRCETIVGWTYDKAYEPSQKYKEGKFIIEKINLHLEESDYYTVDRPAGERGDKWRVRSMSWGSERSLSVGSYGEAATMTTKTTATMTSIGGGVALSPSGVAMGSGSPGGLYYSRGGGGGGGSTYTGGGSAAYSSSYHRPSPQTPTRRSPGMAMMSPVSPRSPSDIIYEYRRDNNNNP